MAKTNKKQIILLILIVMATLVALYFMNKDKINILKKSGSVVIDSEQVNQIRADKDKIDKVLQDNKDLLQTDQTFLNNLDSYINLPMSEEEYRNFIGTVHNNYPFGNPISEKK